MMKTSIFLLLCITLLTSCGNSDPDDENIPPAMAGSPEQPAIKGQAVFTQKCALCHGSSGTAGVGNAANLHTSRLDSAAVMHIISKGRNTMPAFSGQLTPEEIKDVAGYVMTLRE